MNFGDIGYFGGWWWGGMVNCTETCMEFLMVFINQIFENRLIKDIRLKTIILKSKFRRHLDRIIHVISDRSITTYLIPMQETNVSS